MSLMIVTKVDREAGTITVRDATRWETLRYYLRRPFAWLLKKWKRRNWHRMRVASRRSPYTVVMSDPADVWHFQPADKVSETERN